MIPSFIIQGKKKRVWVLFCRLISHEIVEPSSNYKMNWNVPIDRAKTREITGRLSAKVFSEYSFEWVEA